MPSDDKYDVLKYLVMYIIDTYLIHIHKMRLKTINKNKILKVKAFGLDKIFFKNYRKYN